MRRIAILLLTMWLLEWQESVPSVTYTKPTTSTGAPVANVQLNYEPRRTTQNQDGSPLSKNQAMQIRNELKKDLKNREVKLYKIEEVR